MLTQVGALCLNFSPGTLDPLLVVLLVALVPLVPLVVRLVVLVVLLLVPLDDPLVPLLAPLSLISRRPLLEP